MILFFLLSLIGAGNAFAHSVEINVVPDGDTVRGRVTFGQDVPAPDTTVMILDLEGSPVDTALTANDGRFTYQPKGREALKYIVETIDGHRASQTIALLDPETRDSPLREEAIEHLVTEGDIVRVMERLDLMDRRTRTRDVFAGLGYIAGIMGLILFWKSRSAKRHP